MTKSEAIEKGVNLAALGALIFGIAGDATKAQVLIELGNQLPVTVNDVAVAVGGLVAALTKPIISLGSLFGRLFAK